MKTITDETLCYILRSEHGASAACVADGDSAGLKRFFRSVGGKRKCEVVSIEEARKLLTSHQWHKKYGLPIPDRAPDGEFSRFQTWVNKATSWIGGENALCVDAKNRICRNGGDMQRAHDEGAFPVRFYFGAGGESAAEQKRSKANAKAALKMKYPWRFAR